MITPRQIEWMAGFLEGEGTFNKTTPSSQSMGFGSIRVAVSSTDKDVVLKLANLLGFGSLHVFEPYKSVSGYANRLKQYRWECSGVNAAGLMMTLLPLMGERRTARIKELLAFWRSTKRSKLYARPRKVFAFA